MPVRLLQITSIQLYLLTVLTLAKMQACHLCKLKWVPIMILCVFLRRLPI